MEFHLIGNRHTHIKTLNVTLINDEYTSECVAVCSLPQLIEITYVIKLI